MRGIMSVDNIKQRDTILNLLKQHTDWRTQCLNLVAAENTMSPLARQLLSSDLEQRYGDYTGRDLTARHYLGTQFITELEIEISKIACEVLHADFVELRAVSGHIAGNCLLMALCKPGDLVLELGRHDGGHRIATKFASAPLIDLKVDYLPFDSTVFNIDVEQTLEMVRRRRPRLIILGASNFLFPIPLQELMVGLREFPETVVIYDASHVLGLVVGKRFQDPLMEGAHVVLSGTQKSFPGPQSGVIYTNSETLMESISAVVYPAMMSNHHLARLPALGISLLEMKHWGAEYADQVIRNAKSLAKALVEQEIPLVGTENNYTESHTVLIKTSKLGSSEILGNRLQEAGIITTPTRFPDLLGGTGLRLGTNEVTRHGATETHMREIARMIADLLLNRSSIERIRRDVVSLSNTLCGCAYTWLT
jgi:glycine hydroxymethyltransferase